MSQNQLLAKNSAILYFRLIVTSILGMLATRFVLQYIGLSDFGLYSVVGSVVIMMNFFNTVMISTTYRYVAFEMGRNDGRDVNKVFNISMSIHIAMIGILILLSESLGIWYINHKLILEPGKLDVAVIVYRLSIVAAIFNIFSIPFQGFITALEKFSVRVGIEVLRSVLNILLVLSLVLIENNRLVIYALMMAALTLLSTLLYIFYCKRYYFDNVKWVFQYDTAKYKEMIAYSGWITIGAAAQVGKDTGSQVIINSFFGTILNASFGVANSLNSFVKMFASSISQAAIPQITKSYSVGDHKRTKILVSSITKYSFLLMYLPALPILLETEFILKLWLGDVPVYSVAFCRLMIINGLIDCLITGVPAAAQASGKIKWFQMTMSIVMLLSLPISYMLFDIGYPPFYIIWVYISSSALNVLFSLYLLKRIIRFDIIYLLKKSFLKVLIVFVSTIPLFFIIEVFDSSINRLIIVSLLSSFWLIIIAYFFGLDRHEKKLLSAYVFKRI